MLEALSILIGSHEEQSLVRLDLPNVRPQSRQPSVESKKHGVNGDSYRGGYRSPDEKTLEVV